MKARESIVSKQRQWAMNNGIALIGSKGPRGRPAYTPTVDQNLFDPLDTETRKCFEDGDGGELKGNPAKMQALHSSSVLAVNIFHYWIGQPPIIAAACGFCSKGNSISQKIVFEEKYPLDAKRFRHAPNIDVVIHNSDSAKVKRFAVESKFTEAYSSRSQAGLKMEYLSLDDLWYDIPGLHDLAKSICPEDGRFSYLHAAQLVKHILGLKKKCGKDGFRLLYLWYDAFREEGATHKKEIDEFLNIARDDGIKCHALTVQELIVKLSNEFRSEHSRYVEYITGRYL